MFRNHILYILLFIAARISANGDSTKFRLDITFFEPGYSFVLSSNAKNLPGHADFLLSQSNNHGMFFCIPEIQFIFKEKAGAQVGFSFLNRGGNDGKIRSDFQKLNPDYYIQFDQDYTGNGIYGNNNLYLLHAGISTMIHLGDSAKLIPFANFICGGGQYDNFNIGFKQPNSNTFFTRQYTFDNIFNQGASAGLYFKTYHKLYNKHSRLVLYLRATISYIRVTGKSNFQDKDYSGTVIRNESSSFVQNNIVFGIGGSMCFGYVR